MILVISGMSCAGKDTAQDYLVSKNWNFIVSTTSRPIRPNEIEGKNYYFVSKQEFENKIKNNELLEYREYHTILNNNPDVWFYGIETKNVPSGNTVAVLDPVGYKALVEKFGKENVKLLWIELEDELRRQRNIARLDYSEPEFNRRTAEDSKTFMELRNKCDFMVNNCGTLDELYELLDIVNDSLVE